MAKRKNPLKDLDAFLKQEASSFVKPDSTPASEESSYTLNSKEEIIEAIGQLAEQNPANYREALFDIVKTAIEQLDYTSSEDKMLINTILYLKDKNNWKENISSYWEEHL